MTPEKAYIILVEGDVDQVCETQKDATRETRDLRAMGVGHVRVVVCPWDDQDEMIERLET